MKKFFKILGTIVLIPILGFIGLVIYYLINPSEPAQQETQTETSSTVDVNQEITFGDYIAKFDKFDIKDGVITVSLTITNNGATGKNIDNIIGTTVFQADTALSKSSNNLYNDSNESTLQEYLDPGQSKTIELKYKMVSDDNLFEFDMFNDSSLGLSDQGLGSDLYVKINPVDNTFTTDIRNEANHG